jgi:hypothetical protein
LGLHAPPFGVVVYLSITGIAHLDPAFMEARDREAQLATVAGPARRGEVVQLAGAAQPAPFNSSNTIAVAHARRRQRPPPRASSNSSARFCGRHWGDPTPVTYPSRTSWI